MQADENLLACTVPSPGDPELGAVCLSSTQTGPAHLGLSHSSDSHRSLFPPLAHCYCPAAPFARLHAAAARSQSCLCPDCAHRPPAKLSVLSLASSHPRPHHVAVISSSASPLHTSALPRPPPPCSGCMPCTGCYPTAGILPLPMAASSFQAGILWAFLPPAPSLLPPPPHPHNQRMVSRPRSPCTLLPPSLCSHPAYPSNIHRTIPRAHPNPPTLHFPLQ